MEWIAALVVLGLTLALLPAALRATKRSSKAKGRLGGAVMAIGLAFWAVLDPPSKTATEEIEKNKGRRPQENADGSE
jgi:hypothetical protein